jgi:hypothetical protein
VNFVIRVRAAARSVESSGILTSLSFSVVLRLRRVLDCEQLLVHHASSNQAQQSPAYIRGLLDLGVAT